MASLTPVASQAPSAAPPLGAGLAWLSGSGVKSLCRLRAFLTAGELGEGCVGPSFPVLGAAGRNNARVKRGAGFVVGFGKCGRERRRSRCSRKGEPGLRCGIAVRGWLAGLVCGEGLRRGLGRGVGLRGWGAGLGCGVGLRGWVGGSGCGVGVRFGAGCGLGFGVRG